jgi:hypothetical protein
MEGQPGPKDTVLDGRLPQVGLRRLGTESRRTLCWSKSDSNRQSHPAKERAPAGRSRRAAQQATTRSNRAPAWLDGVVQGEGEQGLNHQVVSFKSPADIPAMPGMPRKSTAFVPRYQKFESISLQQTVRLFPDFALVPGKARVFRQCGEDARRRGRQRRAGPATSR